MTSGKDLHQDLLQIGAWSDKQPDNAELPLSNSNKSPYSDESNHSVIEASHPPIGTENQTRKLNPLQTNIGLCSDHSAASGLIVSSSGNANDLEGKSSWLNFYICTVTVGHFKILFLCREIGNHSSYARVWRALGGENEMRFVHMQINIYWPFFFSLFWTIQYLNYYQPTIPVQALTLSQDVASTDLPLFCQADIWFFDDRFSTADFSPTISAVYKLDFCASF